MKLKSLRAWLTKEKVTQKDFAERIGVTQEHFSKVLHGKLPISRKLAIAIQLATAGKIKASELMELD